MGIVVGLLILSVMMIVHELGHFLTGRKLGFKIEEFAIFMGPVLFSWERKGIKYSIKLLPIGASVRFAGEYSETSLADEDPSFFFNRPRWARAAVIITGPLLNLFSGMLAFLIMFSVFGYTVPVIDQIEQNTLAATAGLVPGDRIIEMNGKAIRTTLDYSGLEMFIKYETPIALTVRKPDGQKRNVALQPAFIKRYRLGINILYDAAQKTATIQEVDESSNQGNPVLKTGDILLSVNGVPYGSDNFSASIDASGGQPISVSVMRDGKATDLTMVATSYNDPVARGIYFKSQTAFLPAVGQSAEWCWSIVKVTVRSLGMLFTGDLKAKDTLSGPVGVVSMISNVVTEEQPLADKILQLLWMFALVSVSLGFMNLLPIPPLDGNHLILIGVEAIRGKRLSQKVQNAIGIIGIGLIILLALAGLYFDVLRLAGI